VTWAPHSMGNVWRDVEKAAPSGHDLVLAKKGDAYTACAFLDGRPVLWFHADDPVSALEGLEDRLLAALAEAIP
jgi:hypothetical protein